MILHVFRFCEENGCSTNFECGHAKFVDQTGKHIILKYSMPIGAKMLLDV